MITINLLFLPRYGDRYIKITRSLFRTIFKLFLMSDTDR